MELSCDIDDVLPDTKKQTCTLSKGLTLTPSVEGENVAQECASVEETFSQQLLDICGLTRI